MTSFDRICPKCDHVLKEREHYGYNCPNCHAIFNYSIHKGKFSEYDPDEYHATYYPWPILEGADTEKELHQKVLEAMRAAAEEIKKDIAEDQETLKTLEEEIASRQ